MPPPPGVHPGGRDDAAHWAHPGGAALVLQLPLALAPPPRCGPTDLKPKTRHHYQSLLRQHILPAWQTVPLAKIAFEDLSQWGAAIR